MFSDASVHSFLRQWPPLAQCCSLRGWIDCDSLRCEMIGRDDQQAIANVYFDEVIMRDGGALPDRIRHQAQVRLYADPLGHIRAADLL